MKYVYSLATICLIAAGCAPQDPNADRQRLAQICTERGFTPETEEFVNCQIQESMAEDPVREEMRLREQQYQHQQQLYKSLPRPRR